MDGGRQCNARTTGAPAPAVGQSQVPHLRSSDRSNRSHATHLLRSSWAASTQTRQQSALQFKPPFPSPHPRTIHPTHLKPLQPWPTTSSETASSSTGRAPLRASQPLRAVSCDRPRSLFGVAKLPRPARFIGDLAVKDGLITEVGTKLATTGAREIDATGKHVCSHTPLLQLFACRPRGCSLALCCG